MLMEIKKICCRLTPENAAEPLQTEDMDFSRYSTYVPLHYRAGFYTQLLKATTVAGNYANKI